MHYQNSFIKKLEKLKHEANYLKADDFVQILKFLIALVPSLLYKVYLWICHKSVWVVCEAPDEARDNGYCFFKYLRGIGVDNVYYAIHRNSVDYKKVKELGKTVEYGSIAHWILYLCSQYNISTQKSGKPGAAVGYVLEHMHLIKEKAVFLQHGITINKATWLFYKNTFMRLFVCGAMPEYKYVLENFGYPAGNVQYLGFCRFDNYFNKTVNSSQILLMPSWREWIGSKNEYSLVYEEGNNFTDTEYYKKYQSLINNSKLIDFLESNDLKLFFYPHRNMQQFLDSFTTKSNRIIVADRNEYDIQDLLISSALMVTDYSSVGIDFAYMKKPVIYYQFDVERFRQAQYEEGYFDYKNSGLGTVCSKEEEVVANIIDSFNSGFKVTDDFLESHREFFPLYDDKNCERIYEAIRGMKK